MGVFNIAEPITPGFGTVVQTTIRGKAFDQMVENIFYHRYTEVFSGGTEDPSVIDLLTAMRVQWRDRVLPLLTNHYTVPLYEAAIIASVTEPVPKRFLKHFASLQQLAGDPLVDKGGVAGTAATLFDTVTVRSIPAVFSKATRRTTRFSPIPSVNYTADNQHWDDAYVALWNTAMIPSSWTFANPLWRGTWYPICFASSVAALVSPQPPSPYPWNTPYSRIVAVNANNLVRSQVSRKPRSVLGF